MHLPDGFLDAHRDGEEVAIELPCRLNITFLVTYRTIYRTTHRVTSANSLPAHTA